MKVKNVILMCKLKYINFRGKVKNVILSQTEILLKVA